jgi:hypothetical protein
MIIREYENWCGSYGVEQGLSNCVPRTTGGPRRSAGGFRRKTIARTVSDTERMKNTLIYVCAKTAFVG